MNIDNVNLKKSRHLRFDVPTWSYEYYKEKTEKTTSLKSLLLDKKDYVNILKEVGIEIVRELITTGNKIYLPKGLGFLQMMKYKNGKKRPHRFFSTLDKINNVKRNIAKWKYTAVWKKNSNPHSKTSILSNTGRYYRFTLTAVWYKLANHAVFKHERKVNATDFFNKKGWMLYDITTQKVKGKTL